MAQRRMFSMKIVGSDAFLDMPFTSRELYFQMGMYADDDGFVSPRKIMRMTGAGEDDLKILIAKRFLIPFENGVVVVKHWKMNNELKKDRYTPTQYSEQKDTLYLKENGAYTQDPKQGIKLLTEPRKQNVSTLDTQVRLGKVRLGKDSKQGVELPEWLNQSKWQEWLDYRKERRLTCTETTLSKQIKFLEIYKNDHQTIIEKSITNGWQGLFLIIDAKSKALAYKNPGTTKPEITTTKIKV